MYVVLFVKKSNHSNVVGVFRDESLAKLYCQMKNKDVRLFTPGGRYDWRKVDFLDDCPDLVRFALESSK